RVAVGRDHAVRGGVAALAEPLLELHPEVRTVAARVKDVARVDPLPAAVEHADRAEAALDRLAELEDDLLGQLLLRRPRERLGALEHGVRPGRGGHGQHGQQREDEGDRESPHQASSARFGPPALAGRPVRRRRTTANAPPAISATSTPRPMNNSGDVPDEDAGTHSSVPRAFAFAPPTVIGTSQSKIFVRLLSSLTWGGVPFSIRWVRW